MDRLDYSTAIETCVFLLLITVPHCLCQTLLITRFELFTAEVWHCLNLQRYFCPKYTLLE